jgi:hypothetical protein
MAGGRHARIHTRVGVFSFAAEGQGLLCKVGSGVEEEGRSAAAHSTLCAPWWGIGLYPEHVGLVRGTTCECQHHPLSTRRGCG